MSKQKLELTWIGKEKRPKLEPHILLEDPARSYHAKRRVASADFFDNLLALEAEFTGKVKCVFIDPECAAQRTSLDEDADQARLYPEAGLNPSGINSRG